jgi:hypothetical protein
VTEDVDETVGFKIGPSIPPVPDDPGRDVELVDGLLVVVDETSGNKPDGPIMGLRMPAVSEEVLAGGAVEF